MDPFLKDNLEAYLSNRLRDADREQFEALLAADSAAAEQIQEFQGLGELFEVLKVSTDEAPEPAPGFYYRVRDAIAEEEQEPIWNMFLQPLLVRRLAFAALMWMLMLGAVATLHEPPSSAQTAQLADMVLMRQSPSEHYYVRMGSDLEQNRASMLAVMMTPAE